MQTTGRYRCAGNMLWADLKLEATLPTRLAQVTRVQNTYFRTCPPQFPQLVIVGVTDVDVNPITQWGHRGGLPRISPEEPIHALILAAKAALDAGLGDAVLTEWRACILNTPFEFVRCESPRDLVWKRINVRESYATQFDLFTRTTLGRIHEVWDVMLKLEQERGRPPAPTAVAQAWADNANMSGTSEPVTLSFIDTSLTVRRRVLSDPGTLAAIQRADDRWGKATPWNSIYKMEMLARKIGVHGDKKNLLWMVEGVEHMVLERDLRVEECTVKALSGKATSNRGLLDLLLLKRGILQHLLFVTLPHLEYPAEVFCCVQEVMGDHTAFRTNYLEKGRSWLGVLPLAVQKLVIIIANVVYGSQSNGALKTQLKMSNNVQEALEIPCLAEPLRDVTNTASEARRMVDTASSKPAPVACPGSSLSGGLPRSVEMCLKLEPGGLPQNHGQCSEGDQILMSQYEKEAAEIVDVGVDLVPETTQAAMNACISNTPVGKLRGAPSKNGGMIVIFYNIRVAGETTTQPQLRLPPFRNDQDAPSGAHFKKMISAVIASRRPPGQSANEEADQLHPGDCFVIGDAGRSGNLPQILAAFKDDKSGQPLSKSVKSLMVHYTEASMETRRAKIRGSLSLEQCEHFHFVSATGLKGFRRPRLAFPDLTTAGTALGPIALPGPEEKTTWKLTLREKKALYGCARILPGGRAPGDDPDTADEDEEQDQPKDNYVCCCCYCWCAVVFVGDCYYLIYNVFHFEW